MKKFLLWLLLCWPPGLFAQLNQIEIVNFTVKNVLPASIDEWKSQAGAILLTARKIQGARIPGANILWKITTADGAVICGGNPSAGRAVDDFDIRTFTTTDVINALMGCRGTLKEGSYQLCVQFFNTDRVAISREVCRNFRVDSAVQQTYQPPTLITPENNKKLTEAQLQAPVTFRWTPVTPRPREPVIYRLKVWQLLEGQNANAAMRSNQPLISKDVEGGLTQTTVPSVIAGPCKPPYLCDFVWNVQALNREGKPFGSNNGMSELFQFSAVSVQNTCLENIAPADKKLLSREEAKNITFKWNDFKGGTGNTYRLLVWQRRQGQTAEQSMKNNAPLISLEVRNKTEITVPNLIAGPCKPPYLCDFDWKVDKTDASGRVICSSEPTQFKVASNDIDIQIDSVNAECCNNNKQNLYIKIKNNLATPVKITQIKIDKINGVNANIIPSPLTPALPFIIPGNGSQAFTGQMNCIDTAKIIRFYVAAEDPNDNAITETEVEPDTLHCRCDACDEKRFVMNAPVPGQIQTTTNSISFTQSLGVTTTPPKTIKSIKAELVYFEMIPYNDQCIPCNKEPNQYGHFSNGTNSLFWNGSPSQLSINILTPETPCCSTEFKWCIRYVIEFTDCTVCSKVICYEKKKEGCASAVSQTK